jgi:hypothetical protein
LNQIDLNGFDKNGGNEENDFLETIPAVISWSKENPRIKPHGKDSESQDLIITSNILNLFNALRAWG